MPSIPQSLLWISLVVLWLFVLVPMLISKRDTVRRTSDVALATRVLNTGRGAQMLRRRRPSAGHNSDPHWRPTHDDLDDDLGDDLGDAYEGDDSVTAPRKAVVLAATRADTELDYLDVDIVEEDSGALPLGLSGAQGSHPVLPLDFETPEDQIAPVEEMPADERTAVADDDDIDDDDGAPATQAIRSFADVEFEADDVEAVDEQIEEPDQEPAQEPVAEESIDELDDDAIDDAVEDNVDAEDDGTDYDYEYVDDSSGLEAVSEGDAQMAESMSQARRRRYESKTAAAVSARKFVFRKRMLMAMSVLLLGSAVAAYAVTPGFWWVCGSVGAVTVLYLAYLRRQTRIEERVRRRRAQRMMRARLGVENTDDREFDVVPSRLRRPGAVVLEIDDEDPIFEHLDYAPAAREYHLPRAAGQ